MPIGISNVTTVTWQNITNLTSSNSYPAMAAGVNNMVYDGWLYFIILWVLLVVFYFKLNGSNDQPLINLMYASTIISVLALFLRMIEVVRNGVTEGLLTDYQMWIFPLIAILLAGVNWAIKDRV